MFSIGLIREGKVPVDNRVALTPRQCSWLLSQCTNLRIKVQHSPDRCFSDQEYEKAGITIADSVDDCDILLGIKEVPESMLLPGKTYLFFSHTKKQQSGNRQMFRRMISEGITLIDYECMEHEDGQRIIGFGFFAGVVGAHNGLMAYGNRTGLYQLARVYKQRNLRELVHTYFGLRLPNFKIAVTGSGRVAHGVLEVMNLMGIHEVEPDDYLKRRFSYPVYTQLKGPDLYRHRVTNQYNREDFHQRPYDYKSVFLPYTEQTDILLNGVYWEPEVPRLFEIDDIASDRFIIQTISDITDDVNGSVPVNLGDQSIENPVYGVNRYALQKTEPYIPDSIDLIAVGNLPNELPRDASRYFGEQLMKYILDDLLKGGSAVIERATILKQGRLTHRYNYLKEYAGI